MNSIKFFLAVVFLSPASWMLLGIFIGTYYISDQSVMLLCVGIALFLDGAGRLLWAKYKKPQK